MHRHYNSVRTTMWNMSLSAEESAQSSLNNYSLLFSIVMPRPHRAEALSDDARLTSKID